MATKSAKNKAKPINLALQGGGAHGAFTWGVLDKLLEDDRVRIEAVTGTSAGAVNAAVLAYGLEIGGPHKARHLLEEFWRKISLSAAMSPLQPTIMDKMLGNVRLDFSPSFLALDFITRMLSPYQFNLFDINPLRDILADTVDFEVIRKSREIKVFVNATAVKTGKVRVFRTKEMSLEAVTASACLPFLFKTVEVGGEPYWDGGYTGNPSLFPLFYECASEDIVLVQINPLHVEEVPVKAADILDRVNEISFNAGLMGEIRAIAFVHKLLEENKVPDNSYKNVKLHLIEAQELMSALGSSSKLNAEWNFLQHLRDIGRQAASDWLDAHYDDIGQRTSVDLKSVFL